jgi:hypothetical protein
MTDWVQMRVAAGIMLAFYVGVAAVISFRELRFLASVEPRQRRLFALQDVLVQLAILGVLVPCVVAPAASRPWFVTVFSSFALLWVAALWAGIARSMYTYRLMLGARADRSELEELIQRGRQDA